MRPAPANHCTTCAHPDLRTPKDFPVGHPIRHYLTKDHYVPATVLAGRGAGTVEVQHDSGQVWWADSRHCTETVNPPLARHHPYGRPFYRVRGDD